MTDTPLRDALGRRRPDALRRYGDAYKAEAVKLGDELGDDAKAAARLGISRRNISRWRRSSSPVVQAVLVEDREGVIQILKEGRAIGARRLKAIVENPRSSDRDVTRAWEAITERLALLEGDVTSRVESTVHSQPALTAQEQAELREWLDLALTLPPAELEAWAGEHAADLPALMEASDAR